MPVVNGIPVMNVIPVMNGMPTSRESQESSKRVRTMPYRIAASIVIDGVPGITSIQNTRFAFDLCVVFFALFTIYNSMQYSVAVNPAQPVARPRGHLCVVAGTPSFYLLSHGHSFYIFCFYFVRYKRVQHLFFFFASPYWYVFIL